MNQQAQDNLNLCVELAAFIQKQFVKKVVVLRKLPSFEDENFLCQDELSKDNLMVLKLLCERPNLDANAFRRQIKSRIDCVQHLKCKGFKCSEFVVGIDGHCVQDYINSIDQNQHLLAVLYSFLPGKELEHSGYVYRKNILFQVGAFLGCFHAAFEDFHHDSSLIPVKGNAWHFSNYGLLMEDVYLNVVEDEIVRQKLFTLLKYAKGKLDKAKDVLRKGVLHGDFQGLNVIVPEDFSVDSSTIKFLVPSHTSGFSRGHITSSCTGKADSDIYSLTELVLKLKSSCKPLDSKELLRTYGLIDYEDVSYSYLVLEVGRAVADAMVTFLVKNMSDVVDSVKNCSLQSKVTLSDLGRKTRTAVHDVTDESQASIKSEVFKVGGWIICGYLATNSLSVEEYNVVLPAVLTSLCQYYILGTQAMKENPSNSHYVGYCSKEALLLLEWLHDMKSHDVFAIWNEAAHELISTLK